MQGAGSSGAGTATKIALSTTVGTGSVLDSTHVETYSPDMLRAMQECCGVVPLSQVPYRCPSIWLAVFVVLPVCTVVNAPDACHAVIAFASKTCATVSCSEALPSGSVSFTSIVGVCKLVKLYCICMCGGVHLTNVGSWFV